MTLCGWLRRAFFFADAAQLLGRAVVFSVEGDAAHGVGEFGVVLPGGRSGAEAVRQTVLTLREPSILRTAAEEGPPETTA